MIILEKPYTSDVMLDWLEESQHPVLSNEYARGLAAGGRAICLVNDEEAAKRVAAGERVYTASENALDWVLSHAQGRAGCAGEGAVLAGCAGEGAALSGCSGQESVQMERPGKGSVQTKCPGEELAQAVRLCKDKLAMRKALARMDAKLFFRECTMGELLGMDVSGLSFPLVVKPKVGFVSIGVHVVPGPEAWLGAINELREEMARGTVFPESVVGSGSFIVEGFITGQEYAVDLYFDAEGEPVILDVMQHDFRDAEDTSDHLYYTCMDIMRRATPALGAWFRAANRELGFKNFCTHVELRVSHDAGQDPLDAMEDPANIHVIEFNPLRFAGFCGTDLAHYAYGIRTYEWYLEGKARDWAAEVEGCATEEQAYDQAGAAGCGVAEGESREVVGGGAKSGVAAFIALEAPSNGGKFDHAAFERDLLDCCEGLKLCALRPLNPLEHGLSVFPIVVVPADADFEAFRNFALNLDANTYAS